MSCIPRAATRIKSAAMLLGLLSCCGCGPSVDREVRVKILGPEGRVLTMFGGDVEVYLEETSSGALHHTARTQDNDGWFALRQTKADITLSVLSPGCRPVSIANPPSESQIQLERGIPVVVRIQVEGEIPQAPLSLELQVGAQNDAADEHEFVAADAAWFESPHTIRARRLLVAENTIELTLWLPWAGTYTIGWTLYERNDVRTPTHTSLGGFGRGPGAKAEITIDVADRLGQVFDYRIDGDTLQSTTRLFE